MRAASQLSLACHLLTTFCSTFEPIFCLLFGERLEQSFDQQNRCEVARVNILPMQSIPDQRAEKTKEISNRSSHHNQCTCGYWIELVNEINRLNHVGPENEIEDRLSPADQDKQRPNQMPAAEKRGAYEPNSSGIGHCPLPVTRPFCLGIAGRKAGSKLGWRLTKNAFKRAIELRE